MSSTEGSQTFRQRQEILTGPGKGTVRVPFVDMFLNGSRLPLQGASNFLATPSSGFPSRPDTSQFMLVDFNYKIKSSVGVGNEVSITILDPNWDVLEQGIADALASKTEIGFQFGWRGLDDKFGRNIQGLFVHDYTASYIPFQGSKVSIIAVDKLIQLNQESKTKPFDANAPIGFVIKQVIAGVDPSIIVEIDPIKQVIGEEYRWFNNLSPLEYIKELLRIAKSPKGGSNYIMITDVDEQGRTVVRIKADNPQSTVIRQYFVGRERMGQMVEFNPQVLGSVLLTLGGGRADGVSVDPETGSAQRTTSTQEENSGAGLADKTVLPTPTKPTATHEIPATDLESVSGTTSEFRSRSDDYMNNANAVIWGDPNIRAFDQIDVVVLKSDVPGTVKRMSDQYLVHTSGTYRLKSVEHVIQAGMFRTMLDMYRESSFIGSGPSMQRLPTSLRPAVNEEIVAIPEVISDIFG